MRSILFSLLLLMTSVGSIHAQDPKPKLVPTIILPNQFEQRAEVTAPDGDVVVLIYGDRHSVDANRTLGAYLHVYYHPTAKGMSPGQAQRAPVKQIPNWPAGVKMPNVRVIPIACTGKVPGIVGTIIRNQIKKQSPTVPVYLDMTDVMKTNFGLAEKVSNVVVIDTRSQVRYRASARYKRDQVSYLVQLIDQLRLEAKTKSTSTKQ